MSILPIVLAILLALPSFYLDEESPQNREIRLTTIAKAIISVADQATCYGEFKSTKKKKCKVFWNESRESLVALLITQGFHESRFALRVHQGKCDSYECDPYKNAAGKIVHRARTPWQIQRHVHSEKYWDQMVGVKFAPTRIASGVAATILMKSFNGCGTIKGSVALYATGKSCKWIRKVPAHKSKHKTNKVKCKGKPNKRVVCIDEAQNRADFYQMVLHRINLAKHKAKQAKLKAQKIKKKQESKKK